MTPKRQIGVLGPGGQIWGENCSTKFCVNVFFLFILTMVLGRVGLVGLLELGGGKEFAFKA